MKRVLFLCFIVILALVLCTSCKKEECVIVKEGILEHAEYVRNSWSGDYYIVTFEDGLKIKIGTKVGQMPTPGKKVKVLRCARFWSGTWHILEKVDEGSK